MKQGKYIHYNVMLACLSHRKLQVNHQTNIHHQLQETISKIKLRMQHIQNDIPVRGNELAA